MNQEPKQPESIDVEQLEQVTGGGIASQFGSLFGAEGAKWGGVADNILGMFMGGGGGG